MTEQLRRRDFLKLSAAGLAGIIGLRLPRIEFDARESTTVFSTTLLEGSGVVAVINKTTQNTRILTGKLVSAIDGETGEQIIGLENAFESSIAKATTYYFSAEEIARSRANGYELESATTIPFPVSSETGLIGRNVKTREEAESIMQKTQTLINSHQEGAIAVEGNLVIYKYVGPKGIVYSTEILIGSGYDGPEVAKMEFTQLEPLPGTESEIVDGNDRTTTRIRARRNAAIDTESSLSAEIVNAAQEHFGEGFEITPDGKVIDKVLGQEIPGFTIVPYNEQTMIPPYKKEVTWGWQRVYEFEGKTDFTVVGTEADITVAEDGSLDMYAWEYKGGEFKRQNIEFAAPNGGTVEIEGFSPQEVQQMIINNSSDDPDYRIGTFQAIQNLGSKIPTTIVNRQLYFTYKGMFEKQVIRYYNSNFIPTIDPNGLWTETKTTEYVVFPSFVDRNKAFVTWMDKNNKPVIVIVEGKYLDMPQSFNPYWKKRSIEDPFNP